MAKKILPLRKKVSLSKNKEKIVNASDEACFWVLDGRVLRNLNDLAVALDEMSEETYSHHVNSEKNDFSVWVKEILKEPKVAVSLKKSKDKKGAVKVIKNKLKKL